MKKEKPPALFDNPKLWQDEWQNMPEYSHDDIAPVQKIVVNFKTRDDVEAFAKLVSQPLSKNTDTIWFPKKPKWVSLNKVYVDDES